MRLPKPRWSVRTRIVATVFLLTTMTLTVVGIAFFTVQRNQIEDRINNQLQIALEEFATEAVEAYESDNFNNLSDLLQDVLSHRVPEESEGMVGYVGSRPAWTQPGGLDMIADDELMDTLDARVEALEGSQEGEVRTVATATSTYRYALMPITLGDLGSGAYAVAYDFDAELSQLVDTFQIYLIAAVICLAILLGASWLIAGELLRPIRELRETAEQIRETDLDARIEVDTNDDLADMARTFNTMLDRIQASFDSQMRLLDDAGHELRTPITIVRGHLELMDADNPEDVSSVRDLSIHELDRMHRLADDLVMLAKAERPDFVQTHPVDAGPFIDHIYELVQQISPEHTWQHESRIESIIEMDDQRMTQAMVQLAANAVKFSPKGSMIGIGISVGREARLWVHDRGIGVSSERRTKIFERFGRADTTVEGAGLGLPIVAAIAQSHGGRIDLESTPGKGSTFTIVIPHKETPWPTS